MKRIKRWIGILALIIVGSLIFKLPTDFLSKTYTNSHPNSHSYYVALDEFEKVCGDKYLSDHEGVGTKYKRFYKDGRKAKSSFTKLAHTFNNIYADGRFCHIYLSRKERIYRCNDVDNKTISIRFIKHKGSYFMGKKQPPLYEIQFYHDRD